MRPKMREQILARHNKLVDSGRTAWTTEERDRCRLLDYVTQLEEVPCSHCLNKIALLEAANTDLLEALEGIRDLARTGLPISTMTQSEYDRHRLNKIAGEAAESIRKAKENER